MKSKITFIVAIFVTAFVAFWAGRFIPLNAQSGNENKIQKIQTHLMFYGKAEEAINFYVSQFPNSKITKLVRYGANEQGDKGTVKFSQFSLNGHQFIAIDSPPHAFKLTPAMSIFVNCDSEKEIALLFEGLSKGGQVLMPLQEYPFSKKFAWFVDRFGVSWQLSLPVLL